MIQQTYTVWWSSKWIERRLDLMIINIFILM